MKNLFTFLLLFSLAFTTFCQSSYKTVSKQDGSFTYQIVEGDPTNTRFYTLANGLTVILHENKLQPKVMGLITTRAGSKNDPSDKTGLAHYLEHLLFKGTTSLGTEDYAKEKVYLDRIEELYEVYNKTTDVDARKKLYKEIDSLSFIAAKIAIPNEYDKVMSSLGSNFTNAFTSFENTTYMENVPSNNLEKFLQVQKNRFENPVIRLFHTELETVYEENNMYQDMGSFKVYDALFSGLFKKHAYGTQTTLGTPEHLKNPSIKRIKSFFETYYVPNNMVVILAGDINASETIKMVDKYYGTWKQGAVPPYIYQPEDEIKEPEEKFVYTPDEELVAFGFRLPNKNDKEAITADLVANILYNGKSGLIDKNLVKAQKVLEANGFNYLLTDYGFMGFTGKPLQGQTLQQVKDMILSQVELLKKGEFDQDLITATVNNLKVNRIREQESPMNMAFVLNDLFVTKTPWEEYLKGSETMNKITKQDVVNFANKWFKNNYVTVYKLTGPDPENKKVEKPAITSIEVNRNGSSAFFKQITETPNKPLTPVFLEYSKDVKFGSIHKDVPIWSVPNTINNLFTQYYVFDMGSHHIQKLPLAIEYLKYIGSKTKSNEQINKELYNLAVSFDIFTSDEQVYVSISGLEENRQKALAIIEDVMRNPVPDQPALDNLINAKIKERNDKTLNKDAIFWEALDNYANYGPKNPFNSVMSNDQLRALKAKEMTDLIKSLFTYKHKVFYYGPKEVNKLGLELKKSHQLLPVLKNYPAKKEYTKLKASENTIYYVDYDMSQVEISMQRWDENKYDPKKTSIVRSFNEYYGGSMTSVVFQEIREAKALAYSTYGYYGVPQKKDEPYSAGFYVGTQADKLAIAFDAMNDLLNNFKESEQNWNVGKAAIKQGIESDRITKTGILFNYDTAKKRGVDYDLRKDIYSQIDNIALNDLKTFHGQTMKEKPWNIRVVGSKDRINMSDMAKYGKVIQLSLKDVFGFDVDKKELKP